MAPPPPESISFFQTSNRSLARSPPSPTLKPTTIIYFLNYFPNAMLPIKFGASSLPKNQIKTFPQNFITFIINSPRIDTHFSATCTFILSISSNNVLHISHLIRASLGNTLSPSAALQNPLSSFFFSSPLPTVGLSLPCLPAYLLASRTTYFSFNAPPFCLYPIHHSTSLAIISYNTPPPHTPSRPLLAPPVRSPLSHTSSHLLCVDVHPVPWQTRLAPQFLLPLTSET